MATTISLTIPDSAATRIVDAFASEFGWTSDLGVTKAVFAKQQLVEYVKQVTRNYEGNIAASSARTTVNSDVNSFAIT